MAPPEPSLLRQPDFRRFRASRLAGTVAGQMLRVALGWQMYGLTGSAWDLRLVGLAQFVPALLPALPAGHQIDRHDRRRMLAVVLALQVAAALGLALASAAGWMGRDALPAVSPALGALRAFQMPTSQALLPQLVPAERLPQALAQSSTALQGAIIAGPALGGFVYAGGAVAVYGATMVLIGLPIQLWLSRVVLAASGAADMVSVVIRQSMVQLATPDAMRGGVSTVNSVFVGASNQLGEFESRPTAALFGPVASVTWGGVGTGLVVLAWLGLFPALARHDRLVRDPATDAPDSPQNGSKPA